MLKIAPSRRDSRAAVAGDARLSLPSEPLPTNACDAESPQRPALGQGPALLAAPDTRLPCAQPQAGLLPAHLGPVPNRGRNGKKPLGKSGVKRSNLIKLTKSCTPLEITNDIYKHSTNTRQSIHLPLSLQSAPSS